MSAQPEWPKGAPRPDPDEMVAVLMSEQMARTLEARWLRPNMELAGPLLFKEDDVPTYILGVTDLALGRTVRETAERERAPE